MLAQKITPVKLSDDVLLKLVTNLKDTYVDDLLAHIAYLELELAKANVTISRVETLCNGFDISYFGVSNKMSKIQAVIKEYKKA